MWKCPKCGEQIGDQFEKCWKCANNGIEIISTDYGDYPAIDIPLSTTPFIPGREIAGCKGIVCGEAIMGANIFRDFLAGITDIVGGRSGAYEGKLRDARMVALLEMVALAKQVGATAVVGIRIDYETIGQSMLMVNTTGTAVVLKEVVSG